MKQIILKPILSEKSLMGADAAKFTFLVHDDANKPEVAQAVKAIFNVDAIKVNIINIPADDRIVRGRHKAHSKAYKKAVVTLKKGQKIEGFEFKD